MARKKSRPKTPEPVPERQRLRMLLVLAGVAVYFLLFYTSRLPSLGNWGEGLISRGKLLRKVLFQFDEVVATWLGAPGEASVLDRVPVLVIAGAILAWAVLAGWLLMWLCRADRGLTRLETFVFSTAVGLNAISAYVLLVGLMGLVRHVFVFAVPAVLTFAAAGWIWLAQKAPPRANPKSPPDRRGSPDPAETADRRSPKPAPSELSKHQPCAAGGGDWLRPQWLWLAAPFAAVILLGGMLPPVEFDVREYHLQVPKEFFQQGYVGFLPHNVYGNMPMGTEMLSLLAMAVAGDWWLGALAGKTVIAAFAPLTALGLYAAGRRFFSTSAGVAAAVIYLLIPWIAQVSCLGLVEGPLACYLFLAMYAVLLWREGERNGQRVAGVERSDPPGRQAAGDSPAIDASHPASGERHPSSFGSLRLAGYLAGAAVSCKYPAVLFVALPLALWILLSRTSGKWRVASRERRAPQPSTLDPHPSSLFHLNWKPCGVFLLAAAVGCGAWLGKNWALTGNPTYPLLYGVFGDNTDTWTPAKNAQWNRVHRPHDFWPPTFARDIARVGLGSEWLSPLVMPLAAFAFLVSTRRRLLLGLAAYFAYVVLMWWLLTHRIDRFWIVALPVVALLAGVGACWSREAIWRRVLVVLLVFGVMSSFLTVTSVAGGYTRYFVRLDRLRDDPMRLDPWHRYFNSQARDGRVLVVGDAQVFDLEVPIVYSTCFDDSMFERWVKGRTADEIRATFGREGITHVYVHWGEIARYREPGNYGFTDFVQPAVFDRLVDQGILEPLPPIGEHRGRAYRVVAAEEKVTATKFG